MMAPPDVDECVSLGKARVEPSLNRITINGQGVRIPKRDMDVLSVLMRKGERVSSRADLIDEVWSDVIVTDDALTLSISRLRKVFGDDPRAPAVIETIPKRGYRLMNTPGSCDVSTYSVLSKASFWIATLSVLLVLVTVLFVLVRVEYQRVEELVEHASVSKSDG